LVGLHLREIMTRLVKCITVCLLTNIQSRCDANRRSCLCVHESCCGLAVILHAQGTMTNRAICGCGESVCKTTICFGDDEQLFFNRRNIKAERRHTHQSQPHAEDLAWAEVGMITGGEVEERLEVHGYSQLHVTARRSLPKQSFVAGRLLRQGDRLPRNDINKKGCLMEKRQPHGRLRSISFPVRGIKAFPLLPGLSKIVCPVGHTMMFRQSGFGEIVKYTESFVFQTVTLITVYLPCFDSSLL